jgi:hypothetical protein
MNIKRWILIHVLVFFVGALIGVGLIYMGLA